MTIDEITFGGAYRIAQLRYKTGDGFHREVRVPGSNISDLPKAAQSRIAVEWTPEVIAAYIEASKPEESEPPPTAEQLRAVDVAEVEKTFTAPTILRALIKDRFDLENRIRVLEGKPAITLAQFKAALANRIRGNGA